MKNPRRFECAIALLACIVFGSSCRAAEIRQMDKRIGQLETRVAVLESQVAAQSHK
jgi:hypothetical protein